MSLLVKSCHRQLRFLPRRPRIAFPELLIGGRVRDFAFGGTNADMEANLAYALRSTVNANSEFLLVEQCRRRHFADSFVRARHFQVPSELLRVCYYLTR